jgi:hypothetical protein
MQVQQIGGGYPVLMHLLTVIIKHSQDVVVLLVLPETVEYLFVKQMVLLGLLHLVVLK